MGWLPRAALKLVISRLIFSLSKFDSFVDSGTRGRMSILCLFVGDWSNRKVTFLLPFMRCVTRAL